MIPDPDEPSEQPAIDLMNDRYWTEMGLLADDYDSFAYED